MSPSGATCAPRRPDVERAARRAAGRRRRASTATGQRPSTPRWPTPTPSWSPATAVASAPAAGGSAPRRTGATGAALEEARQRADEATAGASDHAESSLHGAASLLDEARHAEAALSRQLDEHDGRLTAATDGLAAGRGRPARRRHRGRGAHRRTPTELAERLARRAGTGRRARRSPCPLLEAEEADTAERARAMADGQGPPRGARQLRWGRSGPTSRCAPPACAERRQFLRSRLAEVEARLDGSMEARREAEVRRVELDAKQTRRRPAGGRWSPIAWPSSSRSSAELRERRRRQSEAQRAAATRLDDLRHQRADAERRLEEAREKAAARRARRSRGQAPARGRRRGPAPRPRRASPRWPWPPSAPELAEGTTPTARARELERELRLMGPINPLALEEYDALQERHTFLAGAARRREELTAATWPRSSRPSTPRSSTCSPAPSPTCRRTSRRCSRRCSRAVRAGSRLTEPDDLLETGIEVEAKPSGKNVRKLSLLSGGERSLTALAFLFAVFRSRPSPFYVMDEVEAALDDVNLHRFLDLVHEFRQEAQLLIVSHQKRTMEAADVLYGVTMQPGGSSKVVSERVTTLA